MARTNYEYNDAIGRLTNITHSNGSTTLADYDFAYNDAHRLERIDSPDGTSTFTYDENYQIESANHSFQDNETYTYDDNGNRTNPGYVTGENNELRSDGVYNYEYDGNGNLSIRTEIATGEVTEYEWDYRDRLTEVITRDSGGTVTQSVRYIYDVFDRRIGKEIDTDGEGPNEAEIERYVYDGSHIALVFDGDGNLIRRYLHGPNIDQILASEDENGEVLWTLTDHQGTVRDLIDNSGTIVNHITYDSFGQVTSETNPNIDF